MPEKLLEVKATTHRTRNTQVAQVHWKKNEKHVNLCKSISSVQQWCSFSPNTSATKNIPNIFDCNLKTN